MTTYRRNVGDGLKTLWNNFVRYRKFNRGAAWGMMIIAALLSFEVFNFSTTQYALHDMLGDLAFAGFRWSTILAVAFCGIDFAGIARIFTPEQGRDEPAEVYYLFGAWLLAAGFNATLTWWGVSVAIAQNGQIAATSTMSAETIRSVVPIFVAGMVWLIRVLIIGTFSLAGDRLFTTVEQGQAANSYRPQYNNAPQYQTPRPQYQNSARPQYQTQANKPTSSYPSQRSSINQPVNEPILRPASQINRPVHTNTFRPAPKPVSSQQTSFIPPEPTYHPVSYDARNTSEGRHYDA